MIMTRREFWTQMGLAGMATVSWAHPMSTCAAVTESGTCNKSDQGLSVLFQGDSITDGQRSRNQDWNHVMGHGYAYLVSSRLWFEGVDRGLMFYNRGISGNGIRDLNDRWQEDALDLQPDVLSILVGINDVHQIVQGVYTVAAWEAMYRQVLNRTKEALPSVQLVLCEPFVLPSPDMDRITWTTDKSIAYQQIIVQMQDIVAQLASDYEAIAVKLQLPFLDACKRAPARYWIWDGIHPMPAGHELIARQWISTVGAHMDLTGDK
jgi:lysophospholipase L1-like esterase